MARQQRKVFLWLAVGAVALTALQVVTGSHDLVFWATPLFLFAALLLTERYIGEERLIAFVARVRRSGARTMQRWLRPRDVQFASALARSPLTERGPPVIAPA